MSNQGDKGNRPTFLKTLKAYRVGLAYFFGSQKELGPLLLDGQAVTGAPDSDLDPGVVLLGHPWDYREGDKLRRRLQEDLAALFSPVPLHVLLLEEEKAHVQYAAIRDIQVYGPDDGFARQYRRKVLTLYGDWHL